MRALISERDVWTTSKRLAAERATDGRGKVFYTRLGYPDDFQEPAFRQLLVNAIDWALGR
ncbi:MAG: hypothetical protein KF886_06470 [Candidatus Hydrogenedentes bacterium]|nr:hypothetical protein [Candidatus Hydrogenedentota bacterium]